MSAVKEIVAYENGEMEFEKEVKFFQGLIDSGRAWKLQGHYGRRAMQMIEAGYCTLGKQGYYDYYGNYVPGKDEVKPGSIGSVEYQREKSGEKGL